jgi:poly-gamma-glutamate synthesis protein (capsule biosynthesis protein)
MTTLILVGDVNLMNLDDPVVPFARVGEKLRAADLVFGNLECCLYTPPGGYAVEEEGFFADPQIAGAALQAGGIAAVGLANNVNYGADAILSSIDRLDRLGIAHTGAGAGLAAARRPAVIAAGGRRIGFLQRSSVYWPTTTRRARRAPASRCCAAIPPTRCRRTRPGPRCRR